MDVLSSVALNDLNKSLSEILQMDFSSLKIIYYYNYQIIDPQMKISNLIYLTNVMQNEFLELEFSIEEP